MFFKRLAFLFLGLCLSVLTGCSLPLNETPPDADPIQVKLGEKTACLSNVTPMMEAFFAGEARDQQISASWDCMETAIATFEKYTQGRYEDRFTARELAHFIEQYFLTPGTRIPDNLLVEVFRIKQLFVGGANDSITRTEMKNSKEVFRELSRIFIVLNPYMKIYTLKWNISDARFRESNVRDFEDANWAIQQSAKDLAALIQKNGMPYHLRNVLVLLTQLTNFTSSSWSWIGQVEKAMPLVEQLKSALAGGSPEDIAPDEWRRFALLGARGYVQYMRYYYFIQKADISTGGKPLEYLIRSMDDLFDYFGDMVENKPGQVLTRQELLKIIQALSDFVPQLKISDDLLLEVMKIKVVFFGGRVDYFVKADFDNAHEKLLAFQDLTERFLNYSQIYSLAWKPQNSSVAQAQNEFKNAEDNLKEFAWRLGRIMENPYDLHDLIKLAAEIDKLYVFKGPDGKSLREKAEEFVPMIISIKNIAFSDQSSWIGKEGLPTYEQWSLFNQTAAELYSRFMYYNYFLSNQILLEEPGLTYLNRMALDTTGFLDHLIDQKPNGMISLTELSRLMGALRNSGFLPKEISQATLDNLSKVLIQKILLPPEQRLKGEIPQGLTKVATGTLRTEYSLWLENQKFLSNVVFQNVGSDIGKSGPAILADLNSAAATIPLMELKMIYSSPVTLSFDHLGRLYLSQPPLNYQKSTADTINLVRSVVRMAIRSYAMDLSRINTYQGITKAEANALFQDVRPLTLEMNLLTPSSKDFADNRFRDANLFTPVGNGDDLADFREVSNLAMMILSGIKIDSLLYEKLEKACDIKKTGPTKDDWRVQLDCLWETYQVEMPQQFVSMPDYLKYQATLDSTRAQNMFIGLLKAAGAVIGEDNSVRISDLSLYPHIVQYVEAIFQQYDSDRNGQLSTSEALKAYPTYRTILIQVSGLSNEQQLKGLFTWLLKYGKPPQTLADKLKFMTWWVPKGEAGWDISADREMLAKILGFIADALAKPQTSSPAQPLMFQELN